MSEKYLIFMDVSGDVVPEILEQYDLHFVPMEYSVGEDMRVLNGPAEAEALKEFYDGQRGGDLTQTSQISPYLYEGYFGPYMKEGYSILYLALSGGLSATYQSACLAKAELKEKYPDVDLYPFNTLSASGGMGVLAERALRNQTKDMSIEDNYNDLVSAAGRIRHWFGVQDLMYLKRGGRVSAASAVIGTALNVRPLIKIDETGALVVTEKKRGNKAAAKTILQLFESTYDEAGEDPVYIIDGDCPEMAEFFEAELKGTHPDALIRRSGLSPIIGAHTGPGMFALCYMGK